MIHASSSQTPRNGRTGTRMTVADRDLATLDVVAVAYLCDERVTRTEYGEFLSTLARWLLNAERLAQI